MYIKTTFGEGLGLLFNRRHGTDAPLSESGFYARKHISMRIWHKQLIPKLCTKHLVACWREALGAYSIITEDKKGYRNHPATQEYIDCPEALHNVLTLLKQESIKRGYNFKKVPDRIAFGGQVNEWQSLEEQITWLKTKKCDCLI